MSSTGATGEGGSMPGITIWGLTGFAGGASATGTGSGASGGGGGGFLSAGGNGVVGPSQTGGAGGNGGGGGGAGSASGSSKGGNGGNGFVILRFYS